MNGQTDTRILVDTCFLVSLVNTGDAQHASAEEYFRWFLSQKADLYLSAITLSEFQEKQDLEILENFKVIAFGLDETAAQHKHFSRGDVSGLPSTQRVLVKDDIKILSTAFAHDIPAVLSANDDFNKLAASRGLKVINYITPLSDYLGQLPLGK